MRDFMICGISCSASYFIGLVCGIATGYRAGRKVEGGK